MYFYKDYVSTLSKRLEAALSTIETEHNFEFGSEFEIALCQTLRMALAERFGISRGYVVDMLGEARGDDIVIYEQARFPTLAMRERNNFSRKEFVPLEATYSYIEAKHTINLEGNDPQSLLKACEQVSKVKELASTRPAITPSQIGPYLNMGSLFKANMPPDFPETLNPMFGIIFARHVRSSKGKPKITDAEEIQSILTQISISTTYAPDLIILGENNVILPVLPNNDESRSLRSPFFIEGKSLYHPIVVDGVAFGIGLLSLMAALDWIQLGVMSWHKILVNALKLPND
ncbi:MAG: hypothetical protein DWQ04_31385 [Chloroflexi bacterium]|nr:MAG: hypothetical protein DWQ04_31385 [Chloroflexota bacterium]